MSDLATVVIGASRGLGRATVDALAQRGEEHLVCGYHIDREGAESTAAMARELGAEACCLQMNLSDAGSMETAAAMISDRGWVAARIVASASTGRWVPLFEAGRRTLRRTMAVMGLPLVALADRFGDDLAQAGEEGALLGLSSLGATRVLPFYAPMGMAKAVLEASVCSVAERFQDSGVRVNVLRPWIVDTDSFRASPAPGITEKLTVLRTPMGRMLQPADVGRAAAWLLSADARHLTGQVLTLDGGYELVG